MSTLPCLEGLSCRRSPAVSRAAQKLCYDFQLMARRYKRPDTLLYLRIASSALVRLAHRRNRDAPDQPVEEEVEKFSRRGLQLDKDPSAIARIAPQLDLFALSPAVDASLRMSFR